MGIGQGIRTGLRHGGITCVLQTQFATFFSFLFLEGGGAAGEHGHLLKGTLENNLLFLGHKTNVRGCLKIILRNKADHKKTLFALSLLTHIYSPYQTHFLALLGNNYSFLVLLLKKITVFLSKYRVGLLQILNLKNDPLLENVVNYFQ